MPPRATADPAPPDVNSASDTGLAGWLEKVAQETLTATHWFDPGPNRKVYSASIRFHGRRVGVAGKPQARDRFVKDESVERIVPGSGPISVTTRVGGINGGEWIVTTEMLSRKSSEREARRRLRTASADARPVEAARPWRRWAPPIGLTTPVHTGLAPLARIPGVVPGAWIAMVGLGMLVGLAIEAEIMTREHLQVLTVLGISLLAILVGCVGAKVWFFILHRRLEGWCIQGFLIGVAVVMASMLTVAHIPIGVVLDAISPGLLLGLAVGRVGCFFGGCCAGKPTASRWGLWSSDRRVGVRRVPTQLLESAICLAIGLIGLILILNYRPAVAGGLFVASLGMYTLCRQLILHLRAERRESTLGGPLTATVAALVLVADVLILALRAM